LPAATGRPAQPSQRAGGRAGSAYIQAAIDWLKTYYGLVLVATAIAYAARAFDLVDLLLVIGGALVLPRLARLDRPAPA